MKKIVWICLTFIAAGCASAGKLAGSEPNAVQPTPSHLNPLSATLPGILTSTAMMQSFQGENSPPVETMGSAVTPETPETLARVTAPKDALACPVTSRQDDRFSTEDEKLWAEVPQVLHTGGQKVLWWRAGPELEVTGRRLDAEAPPMFADLPCCYSADYYQASGLYFPSEGCWEVNAKAGQRRLRFVVAVQSEQPPTTDFVCRSPKEIVQESDAILVASVTASRSDPIGYVWHNLSVGWVWKRPQGNGIGDRVILLQDVRHEPPLEVGKTYLLFLQPGGWKILCANRTIAQVSYPGMDADLTWLGTGGEKPLWAGATTGEVEVQVKALLK